MEEKFKTFFKGVGQEVTDYLGEGGNVRFRIGDSTYTLKMDEDRDLEIDKDLKEDCDIEITTEEDIINFCLILAKDFIFKSKNRNHQLFFPNYLNILKLKIKIEEQIALSNRKLSLFEKKWGPLYDYL